MIKSKRFNWRLLFILLAIFVGAIIVFENFRKPAYRLLGGFLAPYTVLPTQLDHWISNSIDLARSREELVGMVHSLRKENERLQLKLMDHSNLQNQYESLRKVAKLPEVISHQYEVGQVVLRDPTSWDATFTINVGSDKGIQVGAPVLCIAPQKEGSEVVDRLVMIGRIEVVSRHTAQVNTLFHPQSNVSVFLPASRLVGAIRGSAYVAQSRYFDLKYLDRSASVGEGEPVYTSGLSPLTPEGILVGYIAPSSDGKMLRSESNLDCSAWVKSAADISYLRFVVIPVQSQGGVLGE